VFERKLDARGGYDSALCVKDIDAGTDRTDTLNREVKVGSDWIRKRVSTRANRLPGLTDRRIDGEHEVLEDQLNAWLRRLGGHPPRRCSHRELEDRA
jgi:hypothetical protein